MQYWVCLQAEQALVAELATDVQDDGASPMEQDVLPEAACPEILSTDAQANDTVTVVSETSTKAGHKRKQQHSSTNKLPRCVPDSLWAFRQLDCFCCIGHPQIYGHDVEFKLLSTASEQLETVACL